MINDCTVIYERVASCDGGSDDLGHPKVYLEVKQGSEYVECPYCGKKFVYKSEA